MSIFDPEESFEQYLEPYGSNKAQTLPLSEWLFEFNVLARAYNWTEEKKCRMLPLFLRDEVLEMWAGIPDIERINEFNIVSSQLTEALQQIVNPILAYTELHNRMQGATESVSSFANKLILLIQRAMPDIQGAELERTKFMYFAAKLRYPLAKAVRTAKDSTFQAAKLTALQAETEEQIRHTYARPNSRDFHDKVSQCYSQEHELNRISEVEQNEWDRTQTLRSDSQHLSLLPFPAFKRAQNYRGKYRFSPIAWNRISLEDWGEKPTNGRQSIQRHSDFVRKTLPTRSLSPASTKSQATVQLHETDVQIVHTIVAPSDSISHNDQLYLDKTELSLCHEPAEIVSLKKSAKHVDTSSLTAPFIDNKVHLNGKEQSFAWPLDLILIGSIRIILAILFVLQYALQQADNQSHQKQRGNSLNTKTLRNDLVRPIPLNWSPTKRFLDIRHRFREKGY
jgi:hypothetical protein